MADRVLICHANSPDYRYRRPKIPPIGGYITLFIPFHCSWTLLYLVPGIPMMARDMDRADSN